MKSENDHTGNLIEQEKQMKNQRTLSYSVLAIGILLPILFVITSDNSLRPALLRVFFYGALLVSFFLALLTLLTKIIISWVWSVPWMTGHYFVPHTELSWPARIVYSLAFISQIAFELLFFCFLSSLAVSYGMYGKLMT